MQSGEPIYTNHLVQESSPYLLQHAHNPVDWHPWGEDAFEKARSEKKLVLVSIGYSACHWCHVMERESFEDVETAAIMNEFFVCIKVDREERPDVDQVYMLAVQLMAGQGGWPLNCFTLPDGRPVYGGTYFTNSQWKQILLQLSDFYRKNPEKAEEYASELTEGLKKTELVLLNPDPAHFTLEDARHIYEPWSKRFDNKEGGPNKAPKFPLPNNYEFLLKYYHHTGNKEVIDHVMLTLEKMAFGGIYDQAGGGFARYSTDIFWKVPHFEKMLYDNAQLVSLYAEAFQLTRSPLCRQVVYETLAFVTREMTSAEGSFYSALDADSEGEEGKYYTWKKPELEALLGNRFPVFASYFNISDIGYWEHDNYILLRKKSDEEIAVEHGISISELRDLIGNSKQILLAAREKRIRPGLDDKQLSSWNALMLKGYADAYRVFGEPEFLQAALKSADFICKALKRPDGGLNHTYKNEKVSINGYLEDYSFVIESFLALHQSTFDEKWLREASSLMEYTITHFLDRDSGMFYFTSDLDPALIARKMEINDNVIPASNSSLAKSLHLLGLLLDKQEYVSMAQSMLNNVKENMPRYGSGYSNWGILLLNLAAPFYEVAIVGEKAESMRRELEKHYIPNKVITGSSAESGLPLLKDRFAENETLIYVCEGKACRMPVQTVEEALLQIR